MKTNILSSALLVSSALAVSALASPATAAFGLRPGSYELGGIEAICLVKGGSWYSETFAGSSGSWFVGPTFEDATLIFGHYANGTGSDSLVVTKGTADWMEWDSSTGAQVFMDNIKVVPTPGKCTPPATKVKPGHHNPMD